MKNATPPAFSDSEINKRGYRSTLTGVRGTTISVSSRVGSIEAVHAAFVFYADNGAAAICTQFRCDDVIIGTPGLLPSNRLNVNVSLAPPAW